MGCSQYEGDWGCVIAPFNWVIMCSGNTFSPFRHQAIAWTNVILLSIGPPRKQLSEFRANLKYFETVKNACVCSTAWWPFYFGLGLLEIPTKRILVAHKLLHIEQATAKKFFFCPGLPSTAPFVYLHACLALYKVIVLCHGCVVTYHLKNRNILTTGLDCMCVPVCVLMWGWGWGL